MRFTVRHVHAFPTRLVDALERIAAALEARNSGDGAIMKTLDDLKADVQAATDVATSAKTLITGMAGQLRNLSAGGTPVDPAAIDALATQLEASSADLSAAVTANTPSGTPPAAAQA